MRQDAPQGPRRVLKMPAVQKLIPYSKGYIYELIRDQKFPPNHKVRPAGRRVVWYEDDIIDYQNGTWVAPE